MESYVNEIKRMLQLPKIEDCGNALCVHPEMLAYDASKRLENCDLFGGIR